MPPGPLPGDLTHQGETRPETGAPSSDSRKDLEWWARCCRLSQWEADAVQMLITNGGGEPEPVINHRGGHEIIANQKREGMRMQPIKEEKA